LNKRKSDGTQELTGKFRGGVYIITRQAKEQVMRKRSRQALEVELTKQVGTDVRF